MTGANASALERDPAALLAELAQARAFLLRAASELAAERWGEQPSKDYSPVGWHLGHCAAVQARFLLGTELSQLHGGFFDPQVTPKGARSVLPERARLLSFLAEVGERSAEAIRRKAVPRGSDLPGDLPGSFLVHHLAQHELQHAEHVRVISALCEQRLHRPGRFLRGSLRRADAPRLEFEGGEIPVGSGDAAEAYDNERGRHEVQVAPFWLDAQLVTVSQFEEFIAAGGYGDGRLWSPQGFAWLAQEQITAPLGFREGVHPDGAAAAQHPVTGISWYEADAFARFRGARLPGEHEWEVASAGHLFPLGDGPPAAGSANVDGERQGTTPAGAFGHADLCGNVWEWTSSWFEPYPGFRPYPYDGYSLPWFGGTHRVLRGGSWATSGRLCRSSLRNWYTPGFREIPAGFRCAGGLP